MWFELFIAASITAVLMSALFQWEHRKRLTTEAALECQKGQLEQVISRFHEFGSNLRRWDRPTKHNKADDFYWLVKIAGEDYLFTDEAITVAVKRADTMRERGLLT